MATKPDSLSPLIAIIGCDGSGKSTVSEQILEWIRGYGPAATAHLGKQSGNVGRALTRLPIVGGLFGRLIERKVYKVRQFNRENKTPKLLPAFVVVAFTIRRLLRFRRMLAMRKQGLIVVTDRFPQLDFPNAYDGPSLSTTAQGSCFVLWLARQEYKAFQWMTSYRPDLVIRLNVDIDTACARKPDHKRELLTEKIAITPKLKFNGAPIAEIDSTQPLEAVLAETKAAVAKVMEARGYIYKAV